MDKRDTARKLPEIAAELAKFLHDPFIDESIHDDTVESFLHFAAVHGDIREMKDYIPSPHFLLVLHDMGLLGMSPFGYGA